MAQEGQGTAISEVAVKPEREYRTNHPLSLGVGLINEHSNRSSFLNACEVTGFSRSYHCHKFCKPHQGIRERIVGMLIILHEGFLLYL